MLVVAGFILSLEQFFKHLIYILTREYYFYSGITAKKSFVYNSEECEEIFPFLCHVTILEDFVLCPI
jgi:hypothetical protein